MCLASKVAQSQLCCGLIFFRKVATQVLCAKVFPHSYGIEIHVLSARDQISYLTLYYEIDYKGLLNKNVMLTMSSSISLPINRILLRMQVSLQKWTNKAHEIPLFKIRLKELNLSRLLGYLLLKLVSKVIRQSLVQYFMVLVPFLIVVP